jgi:hypothetical protein
MYLVEVEDDLEGEPPAETNDVPECAHGSDDPLILVIYHGRQRGPLDQLEQPVYDFVVGEVEGRVPLGQKCPHLDLWLDSPGGDAHAAYKLAIYLREKFETVHVVVPEYAKSAATLLALVGSEIFMGPGAELGPLDVQDIREGEARMHSTLSTANAATTIFRSLLEEAIQHGPMLLHTTGLARDRAMAHLLDFTAAFSRPMIEKLDPEEMISAQTSLLLTLNYASRLLSVSHEGKLQPSAVAESLVTNYPTHGHVIDRRTARGELGLAVLDLERYPLGEASMTLQRRLRGQSLVKLFDAAAIRELFSASADLDDDGDDNGEPEDVEVASEPAASSPEDHAPDAEPKPAPNARRHRSRSGSSPTPDSPTAGDD